MELIALRTVRYSDTHSILSAYSAETGRVSLLVPAGPSKNAKRKRALLMPLSIVDCSVEMRRDREIHPLGDVTPLMPAINTSSDPYRAVIALFLADFFNAILRETPPDPQIYFYMKEVAEQLESATQSELPTFHLAVLARFTSPAGVAPDVETYREGSCFDMRAGVWRSTPPLHPDFLSPPHARIARLLLLKPGLLLAGLNAGRKGRAMMLDLMLDYYETHFSALHLPSLEVLRAL